MLLGRCLFCWGGVFSAGVVSFLLGWWLFCWGKTREGMLSTLAFLGLSWAAPGLHWLSMDRICLQWLFTGYQARSGQGKTREGQGKATEWQGRPFAVRFWVRFMVRFWVRFWVRFCVRFVGSILRSVCCPNRPSKTAVQVSVQVWIQVSLEGNLYVQKSSRKSNTVIRG